MSRSNPVSAVNIRTVISSIPLDDLAIKGFAGLGAGYLVHNIVSFRLAGVGDRPRKDALGNAEDDKDYAEDKSGW